MPAALVNEFQHLAGLKGDAAQAPERASVQAGDSLAAMRILPGTPAPLGASFDGSGVNFALYSERATRVEVCLLRDGDDGKEIEARYPLRERTGFTWHGYMPGVKPGQRYAFRVDGPWDPDRGLRFNPNVLLMDPYARALDGLVDWSAGAFAYELASGDDKKRSETDQRAAPRAVVIDAAFDWEGDKPPARAPRRRSTR